MDSPVGDLCRSSRLLAVVKERRQGCMKSTAIFLLGLSLCLPLSAQSDINASLIAYYAFEGNTADSGPYG